jgi:2-dehydropantoate 2-reductase
MKIAIVGAGGVGSYYGGLLARAGHEVSFLARGAHLAALVERGLEVRTPEETFTVAVAAADDVRDLAAVDLAFVAVKTYSLADVAPVVAALALGGADVVPLLNGVEAAERLIAAGVPAERILGGLTEISAVRLGPGVVERRSPFQNVVVGEREGGLSERAGRIAAAFDGTGVKARASAEITVDLWRKLAFISTLAAACGLARAPLGPVREAPLGTLLLERLLGEVAAVARARGVALPAGAEERILAAILDMPPAIQPSFLADLQAGGPTELDDLCGAVARLGREAGVATPVHDTAVAALGVRRAV